MTTTRAEPRGDPPRPRLLVVEDDVLLAALLAEVLDGRYEVLHARTVAGALDLLLAGRPDALLLDWRLPDGAAGSALREADRLEVPALAMTGCPGALAELGRRGRPVLAKPFGMDELRHALARLLGTTVAA